MSSKLFKEDSKKIYINMPALQFSEIILLYPALYNTSHLSFVNNKIYIFIYTEILSSDFRNFLEFS